MQNNKSLVIDTDAFKDCCENGNDWNKQFRDFFDKEILNGQLSLAIDEAGIIIDSYNDFCMKHHKKDNVARLLEILIRYNRYIPISGPKKIIEYNPIPINDTEYLENKGFSKNKLIFALVAPQSGLKTIISTDDRSFLNENCKEWLQSNLKIIIYHPLYCTLISSDS